MNELQPIRFYLILFAFFLAAMVGGTVYFLMGMSESSYLVSNGAQVAMRYLNKPQYDQHLQGLIFSVSFLIAGLLMVLVIILPDHPERAAQRTRTAPPQPRRRTPPTPQAAPAPKEAAPAPAAAEPAPAAAEPAPAKPDASTSTIELSGTEAPEIPEVPEVLEAAPSPAPSHPKRSVEDEVLSSKAGDLPEIDLPDSRFEDAGDDDVVYGNGRVTDDAAWEFVQNYPDSATKFLYRKTLDNKALSPMEDDIYRKWEMRALTRAKVREIVLEIMGWQALPDDFPHNIWRELRDQIFEMRSR